MLPVNGATRLAVNVPLAGADFPPAHPVERMVKLPFRGDAVLPKVPLKLTLVPTGFSVNENPDPVTVPVTLATPEQSGLVKSTAPVTTSPFCRRDPDCVVVGLGSPVLVRLICQLPESDPAGAGVLLLLPHPIINNDNASKNAILGCIRFEPLPNRDCARVQHLPAERYKDFTKLLAAVRSGSAVPRIVKGSPDGISPGLPQDEYLVNFALETNGKAPSVISTATTSLAAVLAFGEKA